MFGMGFTEILLIALVAIIALGPEKLPTTMVQIVRRLIQLVRTHFRLSAILRRMAKAVKK